MNISPVLLTVPIGCALLLFAHGLNGAEPLDKKEPDSSMYVYFGTYTGGPSRGIYVSQFDLDTGQLTAPALATETANPSFLALHPEKPWLYSVNEVGNFNGKPTGSVSAFRIQPETGGLDLLNQQSSGGAGPCHLVVDPTGRTVLVANYGGGSVSALPIQENGHLSPMNSFIQHEGSSINPQRQKGPHAHSINTDPANRFAVAADLGLDKLLIYRLNPAKSSLKPHQPASAALKPGAGPRHFAFHPKGQFAYVINELHSTVTVFNYDSRSGRFQELQTLSTLPEGFEGQNSTAEIQVHPSGKFVYGSNRGHDSIVVFRIDPDSGKLSWTENEPTQGRTPRNFGIDPTGRYLLAANQNSDSVVVFGIDPQNGALTPTGKKIEVPKPVCVKFWRKK